MKHAGIISLTLFSLIHLMMVTGCGPSTSPAPVAQYPTAYGQLISQATEHWRDMAADVADRVFKASIDRPDVLARPIYIAQPNDRPFTVAFYNFLRTELVSRGMQVSYNKEPNSAVLEYTVQRVTFDDGRFDNYSACCPDGSNTEIVVNARLVYNNRFVAHASASRYINDADILLYVDPQVSDPSAESQRNIKVVKK